MTPVSVVNVSSHSPRASFSPHGSFTQWASRSPLIPLGSRIELDGSRRWRWWLKRQPKKSLIDVVLRAQWSHCVLFTPFRACDGRTDGQTDSTYGPRTLNGQTDTAFTLHVLQILRYKSYWEYLLYRHHSPIWDHSMTFPMVLLKTAQNNNSQIQITFWSIWMVSCQSVVIRRMCQSCKRMLKWATSSAIRAVVGNEKGSNNISQYCWQLALLLLFHANRK